MYSIEKTKKAASTTAWKGQSSEYTDDNKSLHRLNIIVSEAGAYFKPTAQDLRSTIALGKTCLVFPVWHLPLWQPDCLMTPPDAWCAA